MAEPNHDDAFYLDGPQITIERDSIAFAGKVKNEAQLVELVRRLYCACAAVWPDQVDVEDGDAQSCNAAESRADESEAGGPAKEQETSRDKILRLSREGLSIAEVMDGTGLARSTVVNVRTALRKEGLLK